MSVKPIKISAFQEKILKCLSKGPMTRTELRIKMGVPRTSIYDNLKHLINLNMVERYSVPSNDAKKPSIYFTLYGNAPSTIFSPLQIKLMEILEKNGPMTRTDLVKITKTSRSTLYDNLMRLFNLNCVKKFSRPTNSQGRPLIFFKLLAQGETQDSLSWRPEKKKRRKNQ